MRICVAACTYNGAPFLEDQLQSIASQSRLPDRMVAVDDASQDDSVRILEEFAARAPFPVEIHVNEANLGYTKNFERAIRLADGEVIALADQDDVWLPTKLAKLESVFLRSPDVGLVFTDAEVVDASLHPIGYRLWEAVHFTREEQAKTAAGELFDVLLMGNVVTGATMAFRSRFRDLILPIDEPWVHDGWIALLISAVTESTAVAEPLILYRQHGANQIGVRTGKPSLAERVTRPRATLAAQFALLLRQLLRAEERLSRYPGVAKERLESLADAIAHTRIRTGLPEARMQRLPLIWRELSTGRYRRRANGVLSALRDLVA